MRIALALASAALLCACDSGGSGGGGGTVVTPTPTPSPANTAPTITSATTANFAENATGIAYQATATDAQGDAITFTLLGTDAAKFSLSATGALTFVASPDFEKPGDANTDNVYDLQIRAADAGGSSQINLAVTVTNVADLNVRRIASFTNVPVQVVTLPGSTRFLSAGFAGRISLGDTAFLDTDLIAYTQIDVGTLPFNVTSRPFTPGLSSIAIAPDYATSGKLYVGATNAAGNWEIRRYGRLATGAPDLASEDVILRFPTGYPHLMGGWIGFGPDGYLYVTTANLERIAADGPRLSTLIGKILRIDVNSDAYPADPNKDYAIPASNPFVGTPGALPEIYATDLDHPEWASFDGANLIIGDARWDQGGVQQVYLLRPADAGGRFGTGAGQIRPVIEYVLPNSLGNPTYNNVVGGIVYRGNIPSLTGKYLFAEHYFRNYWAVPATSLVPGTTLTTASFESINSTLLSTLPPLFDNRPVSFSEGPNGSLIVVYQEASYLLEWR